MKPLTWRAVRDWRAHAWLGLPTRLYLGGVFLLACYHKIVHPDQFALDVATYEFLPLATVNLFAIMLPWVELGAGLLLVAGWKSRSAALLVVIMMISFIVALSSALSRGLDMSCGCFASNAVTEEDPISGMTLVRDGIWLAMAVYILVFDRNPLGLSRLHDWLVKGSSKGTQIPEVN